jgi:tetratricopeptide (TPR) repeat protein/DNA-binding SARP family transcriptional activator
VLQMTTLGDLRLLWHGNPLRLGSRKALGVLLFLATVDDHSASRHQLASLFWAGGTSPSMLHLVSQSLYRIRSRTRRDLVVSRSDRVFLSVEYVKTDLAMLEDAISRADLHEVLRLYTGPFLDGYQGSTAEFEQWKASVSNGTRRRVEAAVFDAIESFVADGLWIRVDETARRFLAVHPSRRVGQRWIQALQILGSVERAVSEEAALRQRLRAEGTEFPDAEALSDELSVWDHATLNREPLPFVGRRREMKLIEGALDSATAGLATTIFVLGDPGIGKTRLCVRLCRKAALKGVRVLSARCYESQRWLPYSAISFLLEGTFNAADLAGVSADVLRSLHEILPPQHAPSSDGPLTPASQLEVCQALLSLLRTLSERQTLLLFVDDLQWIDHSSKSILQYVATRGSDDRILLLCAARGPSQALGRPLDSEGCWPASSTYIHLSELDYANVELLLQRVQQSLSVPITSGTRALVTSSGGNPFFISEALRISRPSHERGLAAPIVPVPYLASLSPAASDLVAILALLGNKATLDTLEAICGQRGSLARVLSEATSKDIVVIDESGVEFRHDIIREHVNHQLVGLKRRLLHHRIALALEERAEAQLATVATHFHLAGDRLGAFRYATAARDSCASLFAYAEALSFARIALEDAPSKGDELRAKLEMAVIMQHLSRCDEADALFSELEAQLDASAPGAELLDVVAVHRAEIAVGRSNVVEPNLTDRLTSLYGALLRRPVHPRLLLRTLRLQCIMAQKSGDSLTLRLLVPKLFKIAKSSKDKTSALEARRLGASIIFSTVHRRQGLRIASDVVAQARTDLDPPGLMRALSNLGNALLANGRIDEADSVLRQAVEIAEKIGDRVWSLSILNDIAVLSIERGCYLTAQTELEAVISEAQNSFYQHAWLLATMNASVAAYESENVRKCTTYCDKLIGAGGKTMGYAVGHGILGLLAVRRRSWDEAIWHLHQVDTGEAVNGVVGDTSYHAMLRTRIDEFVSGPGAAMKGCREAARAAAKVNLLAWYRLLLEEARLAASSDGTRAAGLALNVRQRARRIGAGLVLQRADQTLDTILATR